MILKITPIQRSLMRHPTLSHTLSFLLVLLLAPFARADVKLPAVLGSHMVLQQEFPLPIWGLADSGEKVSVQLDDRAAVATVADAKGNWRVDLGPLKADGGKPHHLTVTGKNTVTLDDLLIGEVWLASGQSNMAKTPDKGQLGDADQTQIRLLQVPAVQARTFAKDVDARWAVCTRETAGGFSAVAYFFGRRLHADLKVPIGLINASRGSTAIEQFLPPAKPGDRGGGAMYNGSIAPLIPISVRGVIWYQGEANRADGVAYSTKQRTLIEGWRKLWGREFSFDLVQIAPFKGYEDKYDIPSLWEAQLSALKLPRVGVAVINDTAGNMATIHPGNKDKVGERLALWALAKDYGHGDIEYCSPLYKSMTVEGNKVRLKFTHAQGLKTNDAKPPTEFEVAGEDGKFAAATATIDGQDVVVEATGVAKPVTARHAWRNTPIVNLVNGAGLPCPSFHTDNWQGGSGE